jgi:unsaturated rhamnogalacturonyl hydrolase
MLQLVADWQLGHLITSPALESERETGWVQATFYLGLARLASTSKNPKYFRVIRQLGDRNHWRLGPRLYHADDQLIGQVYVAAFDHYHDPHMIKPMMEQFDQVLVNTPATELTFNETGRCQQRWCWCDALFMAPATWMAISRITGKRRYRDFANSEFLATKEFLLDQDERLFYRDSRFFDQRGSDGEKVFWSRGNGWVFAGLINILRELPHNYPARNHYESLFIEMADKLLTLQRPDGFWPASLLSQPTSRVAESSGTAFFTYGIASGINLGLLDRRRFEKVALRGWNALVGAVNAEGRLGRVQQPSDRPGDVDVNDSQFYGSGAFLLAGSAIKSMLYSQ